MKIVYLIDDFPPDKWSSPGILTFNLAKQLISKGHQVSVITVVQRFASVGESDYHGIKVYRLYANYHVRWRAYLSLYNPQVVSKVKMILQEVRPHICHFQNIHQYISYYCFKIAKRYSQAVFLTAHDAMIFSYGKVFPRQNSCVYRLTLKDQLKFARKRYNPFRNLFIRHYLKYVNKIFSVSDFIKAALAVNKVGNVERIYNAIDVADWKINEQELKEFKSQYGLENKKIVLFGGRLSGSKGGEMILRAMQSVVAMVPDAVLLVAGEKDGYAQKMAQLAVELKISQQVKFTAGWLSRPQMKQAFFSADICVTPSVYCDPFNLFNIEAGIAKKPVVGTCFGGTSEIIVDNKTGYIVNPLDVGLMAEKIIDLLKNPQKAKEFGEAGYLRVKANFSSERQVAKILKWYNQFVND